MAKTTSARVPLPAWLFLLALPLIGLALLIARPALDLEWRHQPTHFWLVLSVAAVSLALALLTNEAAMRRGDARLVLVSLAFGASAGFLGLHALATPGVLLPASNVGFVIATPVGLTMASVLAALSALPLGGPRGDLVLRHAGALRVGLVLILVLWGVASILGIPPVMASMEPLEVGPLVRAGSLAGILLYAYAAWHFLRLFARRGRPLLLAFVVAFVLLAESMITVAFSRDWHLSWWEWHVLMAIAFAAVAVAARAEYRHTGSLTAAFGGLYLSSTLERLDRWHADALADLAGARAGRGSTANVLERLRLDGATTEELALLERASVELERADELVRPYLPVRLAEEAQRDPALTRLGGGEERELTVLFADLSGFTSFSERHSPTAVVDLLNAVWTVAVPVVTAEGGIIESFSGDGMLVLFNALGDQSDHPARAVRTAIGIRDAIDRLGKERPEPTPRFHIGINTGPAFVGSVGAAGRRSFSAIGDTTNLGARLQGAASAGEIVVGEATWTRLGPAIQGEALEPLRLKGKREPVRAWRLVGQLP
ncbi:MAG TPA: adenylate/guanylate cyclase domain-containing protein [Candidatus Limnocylindria bacterium]|nr:adenylate/guanylate cyclase domain-containing protein [Candidatus Limnocylindria bacterium]